MAKKPKEENKLPFHLLLVEKDEKKTKTKWHQISGVEEKICETNIRSNEWFENGLEKALP